MKNSKAAIAIILAGALWGSINLLIIPLSSRGLSSMQISFLRMLFSAPVLVIYTLIRFPRKLKIDLKDIWIFLLGGGCSCVLFNFFYFYTIIHSQASIAVILLYTSPIFVMIVSAIVFKEKITLRQIVALIVTFFGCVLVTGVIRQGRDLRFLGSGSRFSGRYSGIS